MAFKKIGTKLLAAFFFVAAGPVLLVSLISYHANRQALEEQISEGLKALATERGHTIARTIRQRQEEATKIAGGEAIRQLRADGFNGPDAVSVIQDDIDWTWSEIKLKSLSPGGDKSPAVRGIDICDVEGAIVAGSDKETIGRFAPADYVEMVKKSGTVFAGMTAERDVKEAYLTFLEKIEDLQSREFAGFVVLKVSVDILNEIVTAPAGLGKTEEAYLVGNPPVPPFEKGGEGGFSIITQLRDRKKSSIAGTFESRQAGLENPAYRGSRQILQKPAEAIVGCFRGEERTATYTNYAGAKVLGAVKPIADYGWCLVHEIESAEAFAPVARLRQRIITLSVFFVFGVLGLSFFTSRSLSKPIMAVRNTALEIARGNTTARTRVSSRDEIGELGTAFNRMTDQLAAAQTELARSNQDLEEFSYVASHDLQEPLRKITAYGDILNEDYAEKLGADGKESVQTMQKAAGRMQQLIEALLEYSRVTRKIRPPEPVPLGPLINEVLSDLETAIKKSGGAVQVGTLPTIQADPIQMRQLFQNLIGNALKFAKKGEPPHVTVRAQVLNSGGEPAQESAGYREQIGGVFQPRQVEIKIIDNGIGFDPKFAEKVFQPFQRLVTRDQYQGTGIGLSVVKKIVERHRGTISVESVPDKGTTFTIRLPMA